jgi:hypothetical protein
MGYEVGLAVQAALTRDWPTDNNFHPAICWRRDNLNVDTALPPLGGKLFARVPAGSQRRLTQTLHPIRPDPEGRPRVWASGSWKVPLPWGSPVSPWEAEFVLGHIVGCHDFGRDEKLAWEYALTFEGVSMTLAFQKFGLRAYVDTSVGDEPQATALAQRLVATISDAMPVLRKTVLASIADEQIALGHVNVENHYRTLRGQYEHFRDLSTRTEKSAATAEPIHESGPGFISVRLPSYELAQKARYEAGAALNAFFSMLEHLLLIAFLLSDLPAERGALAKFIGSGWSAKFKQVVDITDISALQWYERLRVIHAEVRNPSIHGGVQADGTDFSFILPGVGPVSTRLVIAQGRRQYQWDGIKTNILTALESVSEWLRTGPLAPAVRYGESGLPLFFGDELRADLHAASSDEEALDELIDRLNWMIDQAANMDW